MAKRETTAKDKSRRSGGGRKGRAKVAQEIDPVIDMTIEDFGALFGDDSELVRVELHRVTPKTYQGQQTAGYLEDLQPGADLAYIKHTYGGGEYRISIRQVEEGTFKKHHKLVVAGLPKVETVKPEVSEAEERNEEEDGEREFAGVKLGKQMMSDLTQMMIIKQILEPPDREYGLLNKFLPALLESKSSGQGNQAGLLGQVSELAQVVQAVKGMIPDQSGEAVGSNFNDIIKEGIGAFREFVKARGGAGGSPALLPGGSGGLAGLLPGSGGGEPSGGPGGAPGGDTGGAEADPSGNNAGSTSNEEAATVQPNQIQAAANQAIGVIVQNFRLEKPADRVVQLLRSLLPVDQAQVQQALGGKKEVFFDLAETQATDLLDDYLEGDTRERFRKFFEAVWTGFVGTQT